ncbi:type VI secretion system protein TssA [Providencia burhodogranariea]|uniref:Type VI secretion-associated protein n=1 Tax=Providencia burhodogranariea DSM 19968 TaxID=1141662 RepID=K8WEX8_9GAMM|nr:type VI secretion system protein TssA [Providencia burhodogranariea]EKT56017.1 type VI secretion-associated protein [Providencia burhodogranariea DSM 19968]
MPLLTSLRTTCFPDNPQAATQLSEQQIALWERWLLPITPESPVGEDPGYDDDFERMREEVNKLSGADTELICSLAEKLLTTTCKDVRVVTYYIWARLHKEGENGLADSLGLLAGLISRYHDTLLPARPNSRKSAIEWLAGQRVLDSLSLYPEVDRNEFSRIVALLGTIFDEFTTWDESSRPQLAPLLRALEKRLAQSGGADSLVPQNIRSSEGTRTTSALSSGQNGSLAPIQSGRELLDQAKVLANYLRSQPNGWLSGHRLMKSVRWDTLHQSPPQNQQGCTRLTPPRTDARAQLKRLYLQQSWLELTEQADRLFAEGVNHFWLDLQWYLHQALSKSPAPWDGWAEMIASDLKQFLTRLPGIESLAWEDGTPFADEVTLNWIKQNILEENHSSLHDLPSQHALQADEESVLALEQEALTQADSEGVEAALAWLINRPDIRSPRQKWLLHLVMARVAEQFSRHDLAFNLLRELDSTANQMSLSDWEPHYIFEIKARQLQLLRNKTQRNTADKAGLQQQMTDLLAELTRLDPVRALVLYP